MNESVDILGYLITSFFEFLFMHIPLSEKFHISPVTIIVIFSFLAFIVCAFKVFFEAYKTQEEGKP